MHTHTALNPSASLSAQARVESDPWLTLQESAADVKVHESTLRREIAAGRLRHARVGGKKLIRLRRSWLVQWLEASSTPVEVHR